MKYQIIPQVTSPPCRLADEPFTIDLNCVPRMICVFKLLTGLKTITFGITFNDMSLQSRCFSKTFKEVCITCTYASSMLQNAACITLFLLSSTKEPFDVISDIKAQPAKNRIRLVSFSWPGMSQILAKPLNAFRLLLWCRQHVRVDLLFDSCTLLKSLKPNSGEKPAHARLNKSNRLRRNTRCLSNSINVCVMKNWWGTNKQAMPWLTNKTLNTLEVTIMSLRVTSVELNSDPFTVA